MGICSDKGVLPSFTEGYHLLSVTPPIPLNGIEENFHKILITGSHYVSHILDFDSNKFEDFTAKHWLCHL